MPSKSQKKKMKQIADGVKQINLDKVTELAENKPSEVVLGEVLDPSFLAQWPKPKMKVPTVFLHKTIDFAQHVKKVLTLGISFYQPCLSTNYTRIFCHTFDDHKALLQYFDKHHLPYHTFGHPSKRKMKVVIRGLHKDTDLEKFKQELKTAGIPIMRVHKMHVKEFVKDRDLLVLAVVPHDDEGKKLLRLKKAFGNEVKLEPPKPKTRQCHRCQKWGHSQRYCHSEVKCVKCAGDHFSKKCTRDRETEPPTCANCGGNHTASYRECFYCPDSIEYKKNKRNKLDKMPPVVKSERTLVTLENYNSLYKKVKNLVAKKKEKNGPNPDVAPFY